MTGPQPPPDDAAPPLPGEPGAKPFRRLSPLTPVVRGPILFLAAVGASWRELIDGDVIGVTGALVLGALLGGVALGVVSWWRTKYWIDEAELRVDTGVVSRQSRRIRIDRLQGIDIVQPFVARLFGLAELRLDVAGGERREGSLAYLPLSEAEQVKTLLLARRDAVRGRVAAGAPSAVAAEAAMEPARVIAVLDPGLLVASLALSWRTMMFALGIVVVVVWVVGFESFAGVATLVPVALGTGALLLRDLVGFWGFTVSDTAAGVQVRRGLLSLSSQTIALQRVQGVVVSEPWLWRRFGWARVDVSIAGYGSPGDEKKLSSTILPVATRAEAAALAEHVLRGLEPDSVPLTSPPARARWRAPVAWRFQGWGLDERLLVSRGGLLVRSTHAVPHARAQSLRVVQGPWQRLLGLADLCVDSPPGPVRVRARHRDLAEARRTLDRAIGIGHSARARSAGQSSAEPTPTEDTTQ